MAIDSNGYSDSALYYIRIGDTNLENSNLILAENNYKKAYILVSSVKDPCLEKAIIERQMGNIHLYKGEYEEALQKYILYEKYVNTYYFDNKNLLGIAYLNKGLIYKNKGEIHKSISYYNEALNQFISINDTENICKTYYNMGVAYFTLSDYAQSLNYFKKCININGYKKYLNEKKLYRALCRVYIRTRDIEKVETYFRILFNTLKTKDYVYDDYQTYVEYAQFCLQNKNYRDALWHFNRAYIIVKNILGDNNYHTARVLSYLGNYYYQNNETKTALQYYQKALTSLIKNFKDTFIYANPKVDKHQPDIFHLYILKRKAYALYWYYLYFTKDLKDLEAALNTYQTAIDIIIKIQTNYSSNYSKMYALTNEKETFNNALNIAYLLYIKTYNDKYISMIYELSEKSKSSILLSNLRDNYALSKNIPHKYIELEAKLKNEITSMQLLKVDNSYPENALNYYNHIETVLFQKQKQYDELIEYFEKNYRNYYNLKYNTNVISIEQIQHYMKNNESLILYSLTDTLLLTILIQKNGYKLNGCSINDAFYNSIYTYRKNIEYPDVSNKLQISYNSFCAASYYLFKQLLYPISTDIENKKLIIVPDGILSNIPFESLITKLSENTNISFKKLSYLLNEHTISYWYSISTFYYNQNKLLKNTETNRLLAFAPSYKNFEIHKEDNGFLLRSYRNIFCPLQGTIDEVGGIPDNFNPDIYLGNRATKTNFIKNATNYNILHLAMHTQIDNENPMFSKLIFSTTNNDCFLNAIEIYSLKLNAQLAVLSACNSGIGKYQQGEGIMSLARAFFYAGCQSILMTLWAVEDEASSLLIQYFYKNLNMKKPKDEALRLAKINYLNNVDDLHAHPFFWSGYITIGNNLPIIINENSKYYNYLFSAAILLLLFFIILRIKSRKKLFHLF